MYIKISFEEAIELIKIKKQGQLFVQRFDGELWNLSDEAMTLEEWIEQDFYKLTTN